jgi:hypothetical protein
MEERYGAPERGACSNDDLGAVMEERYGDPQGQREEEEWRRRRGNRDDLLVHGDAIQHGDRVPNLPTPRTKLTNRTSPRARTISACCPSSRQRAQPAWNAREFAAVRGYAPPPSLLFPIRVPLP